MNRLICILIFLTTVSVAVLHAQIDKREVRRGNRDFRKENYGKADISYRKALLKDSLSVAANYNLASTLYRQGDMQQASKVLDNIKDVASESDHSADYWYNKGDVELAAKNYGAAVESFRQSLLKAPDDVKAKENYVYAKKMLENQQNQDNQQQNQDQNGQDNQNDQNQNQDQNNKDQNQNNQDQDKNGQDPKDDRNTDQQNQQGQQPKITPQAAQQMLQAIQAKEKETQDKVNKEKAQALKSRQKEKNW